MDVVPLHPSEIMRAAIVFGDTPENIIRRLNQTSPKRLTDAELAAEYWRENADHWQANEFNNANLALDGCTWPDDWEAINRRRATFRRFATTASYDEGQP